MTRHNVELFADYFQFYLQDESASGDLSHAWTPDPANLKAPVA